MKNCWFITGTDTNIGKTVSSIILLELARRYGYNTSGYKPIAAGCRTNDFKQYNSDAVLLRKFSTVKLSYQEVNPYLFIDPVCPFFTNEKNHMNVCMNKLSSGLQRLKKKSNWILIEGIGGLHTPFSNEFVMSDWIKKENLKTILVIGIKLGCINHAILTQKAILSSGLEFFGWIANYLLPTDTYNLTHIDILKKNMKSPYLGCIAYTPNIYNQIHHIPITIKLPLQN
ncbi:dethiobiotin synthetase [Buchnera aphidicola str. Bp (Baizongia pistaciae)]|uniref:ATP-dependent dethiobiotin synthetase BioD n=1 Tax=Buchnera aphidicola subsp. Baizongia pistaciae (strain Bp) TaxID=224915 RepID=BIOD_BUCBP|nr:dethiobiotin synthase [Buchnera aphidicola]P59564.1 RecName: Full=ATP-dependent dethiobiotin synthetase BioD; AltName: Full=DTB synthetase; Short=DTBS; AltName: Full=Dethiobiotin synthase [Buchnera aphidicola str. Bp (Baizongia pistaciae)]AAO26994.1 dethiobiotin synthetase [Buchnera aphidicola str. Bp (Baizongia pistaciae)]